MSVKPVKAVILLEKDGSCKFYRVYNENWNEEKRLGIVSYVTAITSMFTEMGDDIPKRIVLEKNEVICEEKNGKIIAVIIDKRNGEHLVQNTVDLFEEMFEGTKELEDTFILNQENKEEEKNSIKEFSRKLNLIINKRTNQGEERKPKERKMMLKKDVPIMIQDVDILIMTDSGQPLFIMKTSILPFDSVLVTAFIAAIMDVGEQYRIGQVRIIEGEKVKMIIEKNKKIITLIIKEKKLDRGEDLIKLSRIILSMTEQWIEEQGLKEEELQEMVEGRNKLEEMIKMLIETETWEKHEMREREREILISTYI